jgi:hypothetical protein
MSTMPTLTTDADLDLELDLGQELDDQRHVSLCETLDRVLNKGVVVAGEIVISVADIDLIYLNLQLMLTSVETVIRSRKSAASGASV